jgi:hypothetical protein
MVDENNANIEMAESYETSGIDPFDAPTPGASLTSDPENPRAWETPPDYNNQEEALKAIFSNLTDEEKHQSLLNTLRDGVDIESIVQVLLFKGFQDGKWSPDLSLLLIEPTIYLIMWIADQAGIEAQISADGDDWDDDVSNEARTAMENDIERMKPKTDSLPPSLLSKMDSFSKGEQ